MFPGDPHILRKLIQRLGYAHLSVYMRVSRERAGSFVQQVAYKCLGARVLSELFCVHVGLRLCTWENILDAHGT